MKVLLAVIIVFSASFAVAQESDADPRMTRVEEWLEAILQHEPGEFDAAAERMARWSYGDLQALSVDAVVLTQLMREIGRNFFTVRRPGQRVPQQIRFTPRQLDRMRLLACAAAGIAKQRGCLLRKTLLLLDDELLQLNDVVAAAVARGQLDYVLRRAAMLHAVVAMSTRSTVFDSDYRPADGAARRVTVRVEDGRDTEIYFGAIHWDIGRALLDVVRPAGDPMVLLWYQATA